VTGDPVAWPDECRRVVVVAPCVPEASGGARAAENYVPMFESLGLTVEVVSMYPGTRAAAFSPRVVIRRRALHHGPVIRGRTAPWRRLWLAPLVGFKRVDWALAMRRYRRYMGSLGPETLVLFTHVAPLALLMEAGFGWGRSRPLLVGQHHSPFDSIEEDAVLGERIVRLFAHVDGFVALTEEDAARFGQVLPVPCYALPNPARAAPDGTPRDPEDGHGRPRTAVALARLSQVKRLDLMIRAFARATEPGDLAPWSLDIYGEGQERAALEGVVAEVGAGDRIRLMGRVDDVGPVLATASVNLSTSRYEGLPMSILEAAQCGVPTVAFASSPGLTALVTELHGHLVRPTGDEEAYVEALRRVLRDEEGLRRAGARAREATARYDPQVVAAGWARVVADLVSRRGAR
jgi:glycosyltransferase involved in cell wall biosynthesis